MVRQSNRGGMEAGEKIFEQCVQQRIRSDGAVFCSKIFHRFSFSFNPGHIYGEKVFELDIVKVKHITVLICVQFL